MDTTPNLNLPIPNADAVPPTKISDEFPRLADALIMLDAIIFALQGVVAGKAEADHTQAISTITGLTEALAAKMPSNATFSLDSLTDVQGAADALVNYVLVKKASGQWEPSTALAALGIHNHSISEVVGLTEELVSISNALASASDALTKRVRTDAAMSLTAAQRGQARANIGGGVLAGFRNKIINGDFDIWQRATSQTVGGYGSADRWRVSGSIGAATILQQTFTNGQTDVPGNPKHFLRWSQTGNPGGAVSLVQRIEDVRTLAGKLVTLTFWAKVASGTQTIKPQLFQIFGTGGSSGVAIDGSDVVLNTAWQKVSQTFTLPSISGKVIGGSNDDYLSVGFALPGGTGWSVDIARVSLVEGDATAEDDAFTPRHLQQELALCQRYYESGEWYAAVGVNNSSIVGSYYTNVPFKVTKRAVPTIAGTNDYGTFSATGATRDKVGLGRSNVVNNRADSGTYTADAEL